MFKFIVTATSKEELEFRIKDNQKRGFEIIKMIEPELMLYRDRYIHSGYTEFNERDHYSNVKYQCIMGR